MTPSGDKSQDATATWFDTRANLRREMEERKSRFEDRSKCARDGGCCQKLASGASFFDGTHIFTSHSDVQMTAPLRLVVLSPEQFYSREESRLANEGILNCVRNNGTKPRYPRQTG